MRKVIPVLLCLLVAALVSCARTNKTYDSLVGQGILALSSTDPYLGANLFLGQQLQKSSYLFNFFKSRGAPAALELQQSAFGPLQIYLYYPVEREVYIGDFSGPETNRQWIVRGPYTLKRQDYRTLQGVKSALNDEPLFIINNRPYRFGAKEEEQSKKVIRPTLPEYTPPPVVKPKVVKKVPVAPKLPVDAAASPAPTIAPNVPLSSDQQALLIAKGFAPKAENGDLLHPVKSPSETLAAIAQWYTGNAANQQAIAQANGLTPDAQLAPRTRIRVPAALVKEIKLMP